MKLLTDCLPGTFYEVSGQWLLPTTGLSAGSTLVVGPRLPVTCMFDIHWAMLSGGRVGFVLSSRFEIVNGGSYLITYLKNKGPATDCETLVKDENLVVFNYPNKGTLAVSPLVNPEIDVILTEQ